MRNDGNGGVVSAGQNQQHGRGNNNGFIPSSVKALSGYLRFVSSSASTVASTVKSAASAASAIVDRETESNHNQVEWGGFDEMESEGGIIKRVLLLGFKYGFQVWDTEETNNIHNLVSRHDGPVSFMKMLPKPVIHNQSIDKFSENRPLLVLCTDESFSGGNNVYTEKIQENDTQAQFIPTVVWFYSLKTKSYVDLLKFRSIVHLVRSSSKMIVILQAAQIHCFDASTLERKYSLSTNPVMGPGPGPLALGPRWMAYSGSPVTVSNSSRVNPQNLTSSSSSSSLPNNGSLVAHYAKESSKQLAVGIVTLGDMGYKKLSRYYSDSNNNNVNSLDGENIGMVIVRDIISKNIIAQFRAHKSPISSLCFDPSGTLLITASILGHNINVFRILPTGEKSYIHLYKLERGITNAVIQDISLSSDSEWVLVSSSRGTSHLFGISPFVGPVDGTSSGPTNVSVVSRIRSGSSGWRNTVSGAAAAATGKIDSVSGAIASTFRYDDKSNHYIMILSPSGCLIQYAIRGVDSDDIYGSDLDNDPRVSVEAIQKWNICQKQNRKNGENSLDIYGEEGNSNSSKVFPVGEALKKLSLEEKHHLYISEAELQTRESQIPLWGKREICFQSVVPDEFHVVNGEIEIEKVSTRTIEVRSKDLVPVYDYVQPPGRTGPLENMEEGFVNNNNVNNRHVNTDIDALDQSG